MPTNHVKKALAEGKVQIGCGFHQFRSPEVPRILKAAGFDWTFLDTEHGNFDIETMQAIESPELLERAISWTKFPPTGVRGFGLTTMAVNYETMSLAQIAAHINENVIVVLQIETVRAVEMREELLAVPGVDVVMIGPADLSISLGVPGEFQHPKLIDTVESIKETCIRRGVAPGIHNRSLALAKFWRDRGMRFIGCGNETSMLLEKASEIASGLKQ
jgi:2-keto-3-deoxy-L-rhamnonate aldolase RhmA